VEAHNVSNADLEAMFQRDEVPEFLGSCHVAHVGSYIVAGHVPARSIQRLLREKPDGVVGIAVAEMPLGSPGMEGGGEREHYDVMALRRNGEPVVFERY